MEAQDSMQHSRMLLKCLSPVSNSVKWPPIITTTDAWEGDVDVFIWNDVKHFAHP